MTFEQHLQAEIKKQKELKDERREIGQAGRLLLPLRDSLAIQHYIREISEAGGAGRVE